MRWLEQHPGWLLILDNVDSEEASREVEGLIRRLPSAGHVLVTSRLINWSGAVEVLALDVLDSDAATAFLMERTEGRRRLPTWHWERPRNCRARRRRWPRVSPSIENGLYPINSISFGS